MDPSTKLHELTKKMAKDLSIDGQLNILVAINMTSEGKTYVVMTGDLKAENYYAAIEQAQQAIQHAMENAPSSIITAE